MSKNNLILFLAIGVVLGLLLYKDNCKISSKNTPATGQTLLNMNVDAIHHINLKKDSKTFSLVRKDTQWMHEDYPAGITPINQLLIGALNIKTQYKVSDRPEKFNALGLSDESCTHVEFVGEHGEVLDVLKIGSEAKSSSSKGSVGYYVTSKSTPVAYISGNVPEISFEKSAWLKTEIYTLSEEELNQVVFLNATPNITALVKDFKKQEFELTGYDTSVYKVKEWAVKSTLRDLLVLKWSTDVLKNDSPLVADKAFKAYVNIMLKNNIVLTLEGCDVGETFYLKVKSGELPSGLPENLQKTWKEKQSFFDTWVFVLDSWTGGKIKSSEKDLLESLVKENSAPSIDTHTAFDTDEIDSDVGFENADVIDSAEKKVWQ